MSYDNTNSGALFKNDRKESDKHPDYKGSINVDGVEYWISAWLNESSAGKKYMGLKVNLKEVNNAPASAPAMSMADESSDLPF